MYAWWLHVRMIGTLLSYKHCTTGFLRAVIPWKCHCCEHGEFFINNQRNWCIINWMCNTPHPQDVVSELLWGNNREHHIDLLWTCEALKDPVRAEVFLPLRSTSVFSDLAVEWINSSYILYSYHSNKATNRF